MQYDGRIFWEKNSTFWNILGFLLSFKTEINDLLKEALPPCPEIFLFRSFTGTFCFMCARLLRVFDICVSPSFVQSAVEVQLRLIKMAYVEI
jgi:hypothetical protein